MTRMTATGTLLLLWSIACSGKQTASRYEIEGLVWPVRDPRIRLESIVQEENSDSLGVGKILDWVGGGGSRPLFERPYGVAWDGDALLVTDPGARRILRVEADGTIYRSAGDRFVNPIGVAACASGVLATDASSGSVGLLSRELKFVRWVVEGLDRPTGIACDATRVFVVETGRHRLIVLEPDGSRRFIGSRGSGNGEFNFPTTLATANGWLWVGDALNFRIQRIGAASGEFVGEFGRLGDRAGEMPRIKGIAIDSSGHPWVSDAHLDRVSLYTAQGELLLSLGGSGAAPGQFAFPAGIAAHASGRVAVADALNRRVQIFRVMASRTEPAVGGKDGSS